MKRETLKTLIICSALFLVFTLGYLSGHIDCEKANEKGYQDSDVRIEEYVIKSGQTLWEIASEYKPSGMPIKQYIYDLQTLNGITADIQAGQKIKVMVYYGNNDNQ